MEQFAGQPAFNPDPGVQVPAYDPIVRIFRLTDSLELATGGPKV